MNADLYREDILDAAKNPLNYGRLAGAEVTSHQLNPSCGDDMTVYLKLDEIGVVEQVSWEGQGCVISRAAMSLTSEKIKGLSPQQVAALSPQDIKHWLGLDDLSPGREKCLSIGLVAVQKALHK